MYQAINGFTKQQIIETIENNFCGISLNFKGDCMYRGKYGAMCAVGLFIPDDMYKSNMENKQVDDLLKYHPSLISVLPLPEKALKELQMIHDSLAETYCEDSDEKAILGDKCKEELIAFVMENVE